jgi:hypothetical protein
MRDVHVMDSLSHGKTGNPGGAERRPAYCVSWRHWIRLPSVRISGLIVQESGYCIVLEGISITTEKLTPQVIYRTCG